MSAENILVVTSKIDVTADLVIQELQKKDIPVVRFNVEDFPVKTKIKISHNDKHTVGELFIPEIGQFTSEDFGSIYFRIYEPPQIDSAITDSEHRLYAEDQSNECFRWFLDTLKGFWVSDWRSIDRSQSKVLQLSLVHSLGLRTPETLVTSDPDEFRKFYLECNQQVIAKNLTNLGIVSSMEGFIYATTVDDSFMAEIDNLVYSPVLFQRYIPKEFELRATVVGDKVFTSEIHSQALEETKIDWRKYSLDNPPPHRVHQLPENVEESLKEMVRRLGLKFGAIDLIYTPDHQYFFLEINANGQWGWVQFMTGLPIKEAIADLLIRNRGIYENTPGQT